MYNIAMDTLILGVIVGIALVYILNKIDALKSLFESRITNTQQLEFKLSGAVLRSPTILSLAGITKGQYKEEFDKWPASIKKRWNDFLKSKNTNLEWGELYFNLTYLSHEDVFLVEAFTDSKKYSYAVLNRSPNNTYLFDKTVVYYPHKNKDSTPEEHIRLEAKLRKDKGYYLISAGLREFKKPRFTGSDYTNLFDFPFAKGGSSNLSDTEYKKFGFKVERQSSWYDKDDFGKYVEHPWDTQVTFKHNSGAEITYQY